MSKKDCPSFVTARCPHAVRHHFEKGGFLDRSKGATKSWSLESKAFASSCLPSSSATQAKSLLARARYQEGNLLPRPACGKSGANASACELLEIGRRVERQGVDDVLMEVVDLGFWIPAYWTILRGHCGPEYPMDKIMRNHRSA